MSVRISCGTNEAVTNYEEFKDGVVLWHQLLVMDDMEFPVDTDGIPDVFIHVIPENSPTHVSFARVNVKDLLKENSFKNKAHWFTLLEDEVVNAKPNEFPGQLLIKLGFGSAEDAFACAEDWEVPSVLSKDFLPYKMF